MLLLCIAYFKKRTLFAYRSYCDYDVFCVILSDECPTSVKGDPGACTCVWVDPLESRGPLRDMDAGRIRFN